MGISCSIASTEERRGKKNFTVEEGAYGAYIESMDKQELFNIPTWLWIPYPKEGGVGYALLDSNYSLLGDSNIVMFKVNLKAIGKGAKLCLGFEGEGIEKCCFRVSAFLKSGCGEEDTIVRLHKVAYGDFPDFPDITTWYTEQRALGGENIGFGEDVLEPLKVKGALVTEQNVYILYEDADGHPRGWETVTSLIGLDWQPRFGIRENHLYTLGPDFTEFSGYAEPKEVAELENKIRGLTRPTGGGFHL